MPTLLVSLAVGATMTHQTDIAKPLAIRPTPSRFETTSPLPGLESITVDTVGNSIGVAQQIAKAKNLQARILWVDATANLERVGSAEKIEELVSRVKLAGFNTIVFDVKPIVGYTLYPSKLTDKLTEWRDQKLPLDFDPLRAMVKQCKQKGILLYVSMNAFSEGHRFTRTGPGYANPDQQTVQYEARPVIRATWPETGTFPIVLGNQLSTLKPDTIQVWTSWTGGTKLPADAYMVVVDPDGAVRDRISPADKRDPIMPTGGSILVGRGEGAGFLSYKMNIGGFAKFDSEAHYVRIANRQTQWPLMMNPHHPEVQKRALAFIEEVLKGYEVDGVILDDRLRFGGINADFSDLSKQMFEKYVGEKVNWPNDIYKVTYSAQLKEGFRPGKWFDAWLTWRALTMRNWVARARKLIDETRPGSQFGVYAGSWFGEYSKFGNNYAAPEFDAGFSFLTKDYKKTGFAPMLDFLITGCYYKTATIAEALEKGVPTGYTVEAAGQLSNRAVRDQTWVYAGIKLDDFYGNPRAMAKCLQAAVASSQGVMVFDLSHKIETFWSVFEAGFRQKAASPNSQPKLLAEVRKRRSALDAMGVKEPPVTIYEGASGTGF
ncbi:MAG: family 10 glycosylhydrolase [Fimbriimonadaceae bacterium]|nr:family 10 glycosylhydrolase [Fimbriimonadaceae bacterium]